MTHIIVGGIKFVRMYIVVGFLIITSVCNANAQQNAISINSILENILIVDQNIRQVSDSIAHKKGHGSTEHITSINDINRQDSINQSIVLPIIDKYGWFDGMSTKAHMCYFYIIQHSPSDIQYKYENFIKLGFDKNYISSQDYALFVDRLLVKNGKFQMYGTQSANYISMNSTYIYPIMDIQNLDKRRVEMGMEPILSKLETSYTMLKSDNESDSIVILGHIFSSISSIGIASINIWMDDRCVASTNEVGFFQFCTNGLNIGDVLSITFMTGGRRITFNYKIETDRDFYELNISI